MDMHRPRIYVSRDAHGSTGSAEAAALAETLGLPLCEHESAPDDAVFVTPTAAGLELRSGDALDRPGVRVDFGARAIHAGRAARAGHASANQPLRRAVGRGQLRVVDATAGFGDDTCLLASFGHSVTAIERSPVVAALLRDGLERALATASLAEAAARIELIEGDACALLGDISPPPDVIYIDPMYPAERRKSALPRRAIQLLRQVVGDDADAPALLRAAMATAAPRIVVKRPLRAGPLAGKPSHSRIGKLVRYDVYQRSPQRSSKHSPRAGPQSDPAG